MEDIQHPVDTAENIQTTQVTVGKPVELVRHPRSEDVTWELWRKPRKLWRKPRHTWVINETLQP